MTGNTGDRKASPEDGDDVEVSPYIGEPYIDSDGHLQLIVIDRELKMPKVISFQEIEDYFPIKSVASGHQQFLQEHISDWKYPSDLHIYERLDSLEGRAKFSLLDEPLALRLTTVSERILHYLDTYVRLPGEFDAEITTAFIISTYFMEMFEYAPRLLIRGATNSGKSTLLSILSELCYRGNLSGDTTEAALFRMIDQCCVTPLLDEFQDYDRSAQNGIKKILKNGNVRGHCVQRAEKIGNGPSIPKSYSVFAPVAFVNQAGGRSIPEEVINRSMSLTMISRRDVCLPMKPDREELKEIRNELYTIKWLWLADPKRTGLENIYDEALEELQNPEGVETYSGRIHFSSRCRDILGTMYAVSKMTGMEDAILRYFDRMQKVVEDEDRDSESGLVFEALMKAVEEHPDRAFYGNNIIELLKRITSRDVSGKLEIIMTDVGELDPNQRIKTKTVYTMLSDMGFRFRRDRSTNCSMIKGENLIPAFETNLYRYGTEEQRETYGPLLTSEHPNKRKNDVSEQCQTGEIPNNLTNLEG